MEKDIHTGEMDIVIAQHGCGSLSGVRRSSILGSRGIEIGSRNWRLIACRDTDQTSIMEVRFLTVGKETTNTER